jgi:hypothetical protein
MVLFYLVTIAIASRTGETVATRAGQVYKRSGTPGQRGTVSPILVIPVVTVVLIVAYGAAYLALFATHSSAFYTTPCGLSAIGAVYFSVATALTVGFGDITPVSDAARLVAISEIFLFVTLVGIFATFLLGSALRDGRPTEP